MPTIYEIFGKPITITSQEEISARKAALCPFTKSKCDGGGNRHQTRIKLTNTHKLRPYFDNDITSVIPGVCSIDYGTEAWVVCPRRLLGFKHDLADLPKVNFSLHKHEEAILRAAKFPTGVDIGIWPEVYLRHDDDNSVVNYHFDFVAAPIFRDIKARRVFTDYDIDNTEEKEEIVKCANTGKWTRGRYSEDMIISIVPDLRSPIIIEIMTASTSGSDTEAGTDIGSAFTLSILGENHQSPGINKRQVWGRMATQLFAKSALAEAWGGETLWVVQDQLLRNIELTTKLSLDEKSVTERGNINFISMTYDHPEKEIGGIYLKTVSRKEAGMSFLGNNTAVDILLPKVYPSKKELLKAMLRRNLAAIINLPNSA